MVCLLRQELVEAVM